MSTYVCIALRVILMSKIYICPGVELEMQLRHAFVLEDNFRPMKQKFIQESVQPTYRKSAWFFLFRPKNISSYLIWSKVPVKGYLTVHSMKLVAGVIHRKEFVIICSMLQLVANFFRSIIFDSLIRCIAIQFIVFFARST